MTRIGDAYVSEKEHLMTGDGRGMDEVWGSKMHPPNEILIINYYLLIQKTFFRAFFIAFGLILDF